MTREYLKLEKEGASFEELEYLTLGSLRKAVMEGDVVTDSLWPDSVQVWSAAFRAAVRLSKRLSTTAVHC